MDWTNGLYIDNMLKSLNNSEPIVHSNTALTTAPAHRPARLPPPAVTFQKHGSGWSIKVRLGRRADSVRSHHTYIYRQGKTGGQKENGWAGPGGLHLRSGQVGEVRVLQGLLRGDPLARVDCQQVLNVMYVCMCLYGVDMRK